MLLISYQCKMCLKNQHFLFRIANGRYGFVCGNEMRLYPMQEVN